MSTGSFEDPTIAMAFRDVLKGVVSDIVDKLRPKPMYGVCLGIQKEGPEFRTAANQAFPDPAGYPPETLDNPKQIYYATVRLDNGEIISARCESITPMARQAYWYDPDDPDGVDSAAYVVDDVYRWGYLGTITKEDGTVVQGIIPDMEHFMNEPPYVPPRVAVSGSAGSYVLTSIVRGVPLDLQIEQAIDQQGAVSYHSQTRIFNKQGFVSDGWFDGSNGFEAELSHGRGYRSARYKMSGFDAGQLTENVWMTWVPYEEDYGRVQDGNLASESKMVVRMYKKSGNKFWFYITALTMTQYFIDSEYIGVTGGFKLRTLGGPVREITDDGETRPTGETLYDRRTNIDYRPRLHVESGTIGDVTFPVQGGEAPSEISTMFRHLQLSLTGGGTVTLETISAVQYLKWTQRFIAMTARNAYFAAGYLDITMPPVGTVIPALNAVPGSPDPTPVTVTADGIPMSSWNALYYIARPGYNSTSDPANFVIVWYNGWATIPDNWIMIYRPNVDSASAAGKLGTGREIDYWRVPTLATGFSPHTYPIRYKTENGLCILQGGIINTSGAATAATLNMLNFVPAGFRPDGIRLYGLNIYASAGTVATASARVDMNSSGTLTLRNSWAASSFMMMDGVTWSITG